MSAPFKAYFGRSIDILRRRAVVGEWCAGECDLEVLRDRGRELERTRMDWWCGRAAIKHGPAIPMCRLSRSHAFDGGQLSRTSMGEREGERESGTLAGVYFDLVEARVASS